MNKYKVFSLVCAILSVPGILGCMALTYYAGAMEELKWQAIAFIWLTNYLITFIDKD